FADALGFSIDQVQQLPTGNQPAVAVGAVGLAKTGRSVVTQGWGPSVAVTVELTPSPGRWRHRQQLLPRVAMDGFASEGKPIQHLASPDGTAVRHSVRVKAE